MLEWWLIAALVASGLLAGFLDSILGGGGIITLPVLLAAGLGPHAAIATNKVVGTGASSMATVNYAKAGLVAKPTWFLVPLSAVAAAGGAALVLRVDASALVPLLVGVLGVLLLYVLMQPRFGQEDRTNLKATRLAALAFMAVLVGTYDGFLGPGTGNLLLFGFVAIAGMPWLHAAANGRVLNFASNVGALLFWIPTGLIDWSVGFSLAAGTLTGAWFGSRRNIRANARWVKPLFVVVALALVVRLVLA